MAILGLERVLGQKGHRDSGRGKEGEISMETSGHSAAGAVPIQTAYGYQL